MTRDKQHGSSEKLWFLTFGLCHVFYSRPPVPHRGTLRTVGGKEDGGKQGSTAQNEAHACVARGPRISGVAHAVPAQPLLRPLNSTPGTCSLRFQKQGEILLTQREISSFLQQTHCLAPSVSSEF